MLDCTCLFHVAGNIYYIETDFSTQKFQCLSFEVKTQVRNSKKELFSVFRVKQEQELEKLTGYQSGGIRFEQLSTPNSSCSAEEEEPE